MAMSATVEHPGTTEAGGGIHRARWIVPVVAVLLLAVAGSMLARAEPLTVGSSVTMGPPTTIGAPFASVLWITNQGRLPVRIDGVSVPDEPGALVRPTGVRLARHEPQVFRRQGPAADYEPFHAFWLAPGNTRAIRVNYVVAACAPNAVQPIGDVQVRYSILGVPRTTTLGPGSPWAARSPEVCPPA